MRKFALPLLLGMLVLCYVTCKRAITANQVQVLETNFEKVDRARQNFYFLFDKALIPESRLSTADTTELVKFDPPIKGVFRWMDTGRLVFQPEDYLSPNTSYTATVNPSVLNYLEEEEKLSLGGTTSYKLQTRQLRVDVSKVFWKMSSSDPNKGVAAAELEFNYPIKGQEVVKHLKAKVGNEEYPLTIIPSSSEYSRSVEIMNLPVSDEELEVSFELQEGFSTKGTNWQLAEPLAFSKYVDSPGNMSVIKVSPQHNGLTGSIVVETNQQVKSDNIKRALSISPDVPFEVQTSLSGFTLVSEKFDATKQYSLKIKESLEGVFSGALGEELSHTIIFGTLEPLIAFTSTESIYLAKRGEGNIGVNVVNVPEVELNLYKVFDNNLLSFFKRGKDWHYEDNYNDETGEWEYNSYQTYRLDGFSEKVYTEKRSKDGLGNYGTTKLLNFDFPDKISEYKGIYVMEVVNTKNRSIRDSQIISFSDLGLIAKVDAESVHVFVNSISNVQPVPAVEVALVSSSNQVIGTATTDTDGHAVIDYKDNHDGLFQPVLISASGQGDYNYLKFSQSSVNTSRFDVGGLQPNDSGLEAYIYPERDLYRPGETLKMNTIVRKEDWSVPDPMPMKMKIIAPDGSTYKTIKRSLDSQGSFATEVNIPSTYKTGTYVAKLYTANDILIQSLDLSVEEFMPDRIKVKTSGNAGFYRPGDEVDIDILAENLFGPPAADRNFEADFYVKRQAFRAPDYPKYNFNLQGDQSFSSTSEDGSTNESGTANVSFRIPDSYVDNGKLRGELLVTVFDENGRPVRSLEQFDIFTQDYFYGIGMRGNYFSTNKMLKIPIIAVDKDANLATGVKAAVQVIRYDWRTVMQSTGNGRYRYRSEYNEVQVANMVVNLDSAQESFDFVPEKSGKYEIRIRRPGSSTYVSKIFRCYGWNDTENNSFEVNREGKIDITFDKKKYKVGESAKVLFNTPFDGTLLVTLEQDEVLRHMYFETQNKAKEITLELTDEQVPNVYVSATLLRPMKGKQIPLTVAHGIAPILVENVKNTLPVEIAAVTESRSLTKQKIKVKTRPNSAVTIAVVDEGILQIKNFQSPNPYDHFYQKKALGVHSSDIYPLLFPELVAGSALEGGDGGDVGLRANPVENQRVKLTSFWSGLLKADHTGEAEFEIDVPKFSGELRIMAVAYDGGSFGAEESKMKVADPLVLSAGLPRFFSPGDEIEMPVTLTNTTDRVGSGNVNIDIEGPLELVGDPKLSIDIPANSEKRVTYRLKAKPAIGLAKVRVNANTLGETFTDETEISVRPASSLVKSSGSGSVEGGESGEIYLSTNFVPETTSGKLLVTNSPLVEFAKELDDLIGYPHGCLEQTISKAFPQIYFADLSKMILGKNTDRIGASSANPNYNVQEAIKKVQSMQQGDGSLSYWPGSYRSWWSSIYALHFLHECEQAGFEVNQRIMRQLKRWVKGRLADRSTFSYRLRDGSYREVYRKEIGYALFVLALIGEPEVSSMNYYKGKPDKLAMDTRYLLAASYALAGDQAKYQQVLPSSFASETSERSFGGSFHSPLRDQAIALYTLLACDPDHPQVGIMAKHVGEEVRRSGWMSTQEKVFSFMALGKLAKTHSAGNATGAVYKDGAVVGEFTDEPLEVSLDKYDGSKLELKVNGDGSLYYFWEQEGLTLDGKVPEEDNFLAVRRNYFDKFGGSVDLADVQQNDQLVVQLSIETSTKHQVENVVVTDMLPACFEVENPRLNALPGMEWIKNAHTPDHADFRDDRVSFYLTATTNRKYLYYSVRAVTKGEFVLGPVSADAMYDGEYYSYDGSGTVTVR